jgi:phosphate transport system substrate-binding protein
MLDALRNTANSLGYIDEVQARESQVAVAAIQNASGAYVLPGRMGAVAAAQAASWNPEDDFYEVLVDAKGANAYPIVASALGLMSTVAPGASSAHAGLL